MLRLVLVFSIVVTMSLAQNYVLEELPPLTAGGGGQSDYKDVMDGESPFETAAKLNKIREIALDDDMDLTSAEGDDVAYVDLSVPENADKVSSQTIVVAK